MIKKGVKKWTYYENDEGWKIDFLGPLRDPVFGNSKKRGFSKSTENPLYFFGLYVETPAPPWQKKKVQFSTPFPRKYHSFSVRLSEREKWLRLMKTGMNFGKYMGFPGRVRIGPIKRPIFAKNHAHFHQERQKPTFFRLF